ncbi:MAG: sulfotransferase [Woeseiaceae bacterium]
MDDDTEGNGRAAPFRRNVELERLLKSLNGMLAPAEEELLATASDLGPDHPLVFIMGPLRSGTTLFMQWLANSGCVAYPTNLLSRFYGAPAIGAQIQLLLTDPRYDFRNEIPDFNSPISFESENGKTTGTLEPNEFWYFWRRFLPFQELDWLSDEELFRVVDQDKLVNELTTLTRVYGKPFALKGMILNYNIPFLNAIFEKALFVQLKRDLVTNVASVLDARKRQLGSENQWYSFKIPEYPQLQGLDSIAQCAGQVHYIESAVTKGMATLDQSRKLTVQYEEFCTNPGLVFGELVEKLGIAESNTTYRGPKQFKIVRGADVPGRKSIERALSKFSVE